MEEEDDEVPSPEVPSFDAPSFKLSAAFSFEIAEGDFELVSFGADDDAAVAPSLDTELEVEEKEDFGFACSAASSAFCMMLLSRSRLNRIRISALWIVCARLIHSCRNRSCSCACCLIWF